VLDFGCGAGRLGIWLIGHLEAGHYTGVDHHWSALDAFVRYEVPLHALQGKSPRLVLDGSLDVASLGDAYDWILDCFVSFHLQADDRRRLYTGFASSLRSGGRIVLPHQPTLDPDVLEALGLALRDRETLPSPFLTHHLSDAKSLDHWHVIGRR
jgi:SAM-dependent methyltransferase